MSPASSPLTPTAARRLPGRPPLLQTLVRQEEELDALRWMPLDEYLALPFTATRPLFRQVNAVCLAWANGTYRGLSGRKLDTGMSARQDLLIFGEELVEGEGEEGGGKGEEDAWIGLSAGDGAPPAARDRSGPVRTMSSATSRRRSSQGP